MTEDGDVRRALAARIEMRRAGVRAFLRRNRPRLRRRANLAIVFSSLAALFTAGPAVGGETFAGSVRQALGLTSDSTVWRTLCLAAMLVSISAAIITNLSKSSDAAAHLAAAEVANAEFESLATQLQFGHLSVDDAVKMYQQSSVKIPFVEEAPSLPAHLRPR